MTRFDLILTAAACSTLACLVAALLSLPPAGRPIPAHLTARARP